MSDDCLESLEYGQEIISTRDWTNNQLHVDQDRHGWFLNRQPNEPIVGDDTVIAGVLYTFSEDVLKLTVLFPPLHPTESRVAELIVKEKVNQDDGSVSKIKLEESCEIQENTWHCLFQADLSDSWWSTATADSFSYEVRYHPDPETLPNVMYTYEGSVPRPVDYPKVLTMGCFGPDSTKDKPELMNAVTEVSPDLVVLQGDQTYFHHILAYGFLELVYTINSVTRNVPTIVQMDDHDIG
jgi:hypothetical protein